MLLINRINNFDFFRIVKYRLVITNTRLNMKKLTLLCVAVLMLASSCNRNEEDKTNSATNDEAAEIVESSFSSDGGGATAFIESSAGMSSASNSNLRVASTSAHLKDTVIADTLSSALRTFIYRWTYTSDLNFNASSGIPDNVVTSHTYTGSFDGPYISSVHSGSGSCTFTQLGTGTSLANFVKSTTWLMAGSYDRSGTVTYKQRAKVLESTTNVQFANVSVDRVTRKILNGTAQVTINGKNARAEQFSYTGTITFLGSGQATLVIGDKSYALSLASGDVSAK